MTNFSKGMASYRLLLTAFCTLLWVQSMAEKSNIRLISGNIQTEEMSTEKVLSFLSSELDSWILVSFKTTPTSQQKSELISNGLELLQYMPVKSYYAKVGGSPNLSQSQLGMISSAIKIPENSKWHPIFQGEFPNYALNEEGNSELVVSCFPGQSATEIEVDFQLKGAEVRWHSEDNQRWHISIPEHRIKNLTKLDYIYFISPQDPPGEPENYGARNQHRSNYIASDPNNNLDFTGEGVSVGMHDDGIIGPHIDYTGRLPIQFPSGNSGDHGDHVAGTIMGAGNLDPKTKGMAYGADLYVYGSSNNNFNSAPNHYNNYGVYIISKSYSNGCNAGYTQWAEALDEQARLYPHLIHVFSAGNNGTSNCNYGAGSGWGNITGGHKMGKNVIATGNLTSSDVIANSSSRGPASDGRIKPDICAKGSSVYSTVDENDYEFKTGTSMACPGISGTLAQLYEGYKESHSGADPHSALVKCAVLNTADDLGNPGPDFTYGWGRINARRALDVLAENLYIEDSLSSTGLNTHSINVPAGVKELRVMMYYHDYEAVLNASQHLVNNLDMSIIDPNGDTVLPWILDPSPNSSTLSNNAVRGVDTLNNMEQVTIDAPASGNYSIRISPKLIPQGPQKYFITYIMITDSITLTYPNGNESWVPSESETILWDAYETTGTFTLEYSLNNGSTWSTISSTIPGGNRRYNWTVPNTLSGQCLMRISRSGNQDMSDNQFSIIDVPEDITIDWVCPDSIKLHWDTVPGALQSRVYALGNKYMDSVGISQSNEYVIKGINTRVDNWVSVSADPPMAGIRSGRRAIAIKVNGGSFNCPLTDDATMLAVSSPGYGSLFDCQNVELKVYLKNEGLNRIGQIPVSCEISGTTYNGIYTDSIDPGDSVEYTLPNTILPQVGFQSVFCYTSMANDVNTQNDTSDLSFFDMREGTIVTGEWTEDFEGFYRCGTGNNCGATICNLVNGWHNDSSGVIDDHDWRVDDQGTASGGTGPSADHNPGNISGNYLYTEASEGCIFRQANMVTPCIDLSGLEEPVLTYWYHMFGIEMGELHVDLLFKGKWINDFGIARIGLQGTDWLKDSIDLSDYKDEIINVRFRGITGNGYRSDMAIDDISLYDAYEEEIPGPTSVTELSARNLKIYPNPASQTLFVESEEMDNLTSLIITDARGKTVKSSVERNGNQLVIDISDQPVGLYFLSLTFDEFNLTHRFIKTE